MKNLRNSCLIAGLICAQTLLFGIGARAESDFMESLDDHLKFSAFNGNLNVHLTGLMDLEGYYVQQPPPSLIDTNHSFLFNPRLTLFLDAQIGTKFYFFAQGRVDRGFDPADANLQAELVEYALRFTPWEDGRINVQVGQFATAVGNWAQRSDSWENPFITAPLPYGYLTNIEDYDAATSLDSFTYPTGANYYGNNPIIWGPSYTTGAEVSGHIGKFDYAAEIKNAALASRPDAWNITNVGFDHPAYDGRIGYRPGEEWNLGVSASVGDYLLPDAANSVPPGRMFGDYREILFGQDVSYAWHHWQLWAEVFETRFEVPGVANLDTLAYYIEAKYKFTPQLFGALRWNQQVFSSVQNDDGESIPWSCDAWRIDAALTYRFTPDMQAKLQYSFMEMHQGDYRHFENLAALQFTIRF